MYSCARSSRVSRYGSSSGILSRPACLQLLQLRRQLCQRIAAQLNHLKLLQPEASYTSKRATQWLAEAVRQGAQLIIGQEELLNGY